MSNADSPDKDCQQGACEVTFKPYRAARRTYENLKALAGSVISKVKETLTGEMAESGGISDAQDSKSANQADENCHLAKMLVDTVRQNRSSDHLKMVHVRPRPALGQLKAGRYDNPWRYDNRH